MAATERVTILMEKAQKAALTRQARAVGQSVGEYIRTRAIDEDTMLAALVAELRQSTASAMHAIDTAVARIDAREQAMVEREAAVQQQPKTEFATLDAEALIRLFAPGQADQRRTAA